MYMDGYTPSREFFLEGGIDDVWSSRRKSYGRISRTFTDYPFIIKLVTVLTHRKRRSRLYRFFQKAIPMSKLLDQYFSGSGRGLHGRRSGGGGKSLQCSGSLSGTDGKIFNGWTCPEKADSLLHLKEKSGKGGNQPLRSGNDFISCGWTRPWAIPAPILRRRRTAWRQPEK